MLVVGFGVWLRFAGGGPLGVDEWWHTLAGVESGSAAFAAALLLHRVGGSIGVAVCMVIAAAPLLALRRPRDAGTLLTAALIGVVGSELLKLLIARPRPLDALVTETNFSYPSGHSMGAAMLAVSLALICASNGSRGRAPSAAIWVAASLWILAMMWSRTALQVHWLTDTVAGAVLGTAAAILAQRIWSGRPGEPPIRRAGVRSAPGRSSLSEPARRLGP